jgi:hypothetical protein
VLDPCSTTSLITDNLINTLNLETSNRNTQINCVGETVVQSTKIINIIFHSIVRKNVSFTVTCIVLNQITQRLPPFHLQLEKINLPKGFPLADSHFYKPSIIDLLLGADIYYQLLTGGVYRVPGSFLTLVNTYLGHIVGGPIPTECISYHSISDNISSEETCFQIQGFNSTDTLLQNFWNIEEIPSTTKFLSPEDYLAETIYTNSIKIRPNGSFQVNLPLKSSTEHSQLGDSFFMAKKRFLNLEKRFQKFPELFITYKNFIDEYVSLGHARYVPLQFKNDLGENKYFLPHHCVIRDEAPTTKLRVVFDASMKSSTGVSLNDVMLKGPSVQPELFDILVRFRSHKYVLICDIVKMFRRIFINPAQTFLQNILWRENPQESLKCIELLTVTYGTNSAPFLATRTMQELSFRNKEKFPLACGAILNQCYMDDILATSDSLKDLEQLFTELTELFQSANMNLHKWSSNNIEFIQRLNYDTPEVYDINKSEGHSSKVLGIVWDPMSDQFSITLPKNSEEPSTTKRQVLSKIAQIFDPLGLVGPIVIIAKIIMQKIWISKIDWDENLNSELLSEWIKFISSIPQLSKVKIPRFIFFPGKILSYEVHGFCDASLQAYGSCIYLRAVYSNGSVSCNLIAAKSRVAPIKTVSLPRLELCGAVLLSNLTNKIIPVFINKFSFSSINLWTDSQITLCWINSHPSRWSVFVANRVSEIQQSTSQFQWRHIKSADNPADFLSRGMTPAEISNSELWFQGPNFLKEPTLNLNLFNFEKITAEGIPEERKTKTILHCIKTDPKITFWNSIFSKYSSFTRLKRVVAFCFRFINNSAPNTIKTSGSLKVEELEKAQLQIIKILQEQGFAQEIQELKFEKVLSNKSILRLSPFLDSSGFIRVGGRLSYADLPYDQKHPYLLPSKNPIVVLMLTSEHLRLGHAGAQTVLSNFRLKFWPLGGLTEIKRIIRTCIKCYRFKAQSAQQIMSNLPLDRVQPSRPFSKVGVDFGGPFFIKSSKLKRSSSIKSFICVFVCMVTKAVHIELVSSLSTEAFILTLKRFISRRGCPSIIYSDNATNFLGASNQIKGLYDFFRENKTFDVIENFLATKEITWKFIPPKSPHWGGLWEAAIKSTKYHLNRIAGDSKYTFEEFYTILAQIEAILNSRPLQALSSDSNDLSCLTPGHFLIGDSLTSFPEKDVSNIFENRLTRYQRCVQVQQNFWKRWTKEYLNLLQNKPKWLHSTENFKINDLVLLKEDNMKPLEWPLARVVKLIAGQDGKVRAVSLKTKNGVYTRSITKLCPLPKNDI